MKEKCQTCGIREHGDSRHEILTPYREHTICSWCIQLWEKKEAKLNRPVDFFEFRGWGLSEESKAIIKARRDKMLISRGVTPATASVRGI